MDVTDADPRRLARRKVEHFAVACHARGPRHHHPFLGPMLVPLQGQMLAERDADTLDDEARAAIHHPPVTPGPRIRLANRVSAATRLRFAHYTSPLLAC